MTMFDRETRREKILENMAKEARIRRSATVAEHGMKSMKSAVIGVKMKSKLAKDGWPAVREKGHGMTKSEELIHSLVQNAEEKFFMSIQSIKNARTEAGKPLHYSVTDDL